MRGHDKSEPLQSTALYKSSQAKSIVYECVFCKSSQKEPNSYWFSASITYYCHSQNKRYGMLHKPDNSGSLSEEISCFAIWNTRPFFGIRHVQPKTKKNYRKVAAGYCALNFSVPWKSTKKRQYSVRVSCKRDLSQFIYGRIAKELKINPRSDWLS